MQEEHSGREGEHDYLKRYTAHLECRFYQFSYYSKNLFIHIMPPVIICNYSVKYFCGNNYMETFHEHKERRWQYFSSNSCCFPAWLTGIFICFKRNQPACGYQISDLHVCTVHQQYQSTFFINPTDEHNYKIKGMLKQLKFPQLFRHVSVLSGTIIRELFLA